MIEAMKVLDKVVIVTGGANGIGRALCSRFAAEGARAVIAADIDVHGAAETARTIENGESMAVNVAAESEVASLVDHTLRKHGQIDLFCSNAGIGVAGDCWT